VIMMWAKGIKVGFASPERADKARCKALMLALLQCKRFVRPASSDLPGIVDHERFQAR
jgi:hypothetical protein